jgi:hypothetical protein
LQLPHAPEWQPAHDDAVDDAGRNVLPDLNANRLRSLVVWEPLHLGQGTCSELDMTSSSNWVRQSSQMNS